MDIRLISRKAPMLDRRRFIFIDIHIVLDELNSFNKWIESF